MIPLSPHSWDLDTYKDFFHLTAKYASHLLSNSELFATFGLNLQD